MPLVSIRAIMKQARKQDILKTCHQITFRGTVYVLSLFNAFLIALVHKYAPLARVKLLFKLIPFDYNMNISII